MYTITSLCTHMTTRCEQLVVCLFPCITDDDGETGSLNTAKVERGVNWSTSSWVSRPSGDYRKQWLLSSTPSPDTPPFTHVPVTCVSVSL